MADREAVKNALASGQKPKGEAFSDLVDLIPEVEGLPTQQEWAALEAKVEELETKVAAMEGAEP